MILSKRYELPAAHRLTAGVPEKHKCRRLHGHNYYLTIRISGFAAPDGMLVEYDTIDGIVKPILRLVDHQDLNTLNERCSTKEAEAVAANPTVELLIMWFAERLRLVSSARSSGADKPGEQMLCLHSLKLEEAENVWVEWHNPLAPAWRP